MVRFCHTAQYIHPAGSVSACQTDGKSVPTEPGSASTIRIRQLSTGGLDAIAFYPAD